MTDELLIEAFKWIKTHYSQRKRVDDTSELVSYLTEKLIICHNNFKPELGCWEHYYRATIYREFLKYQYRDSLRPERAMASDDGEFDHASPNLRADELIIMAEFLSRLTGIDQKIMAAVHDGIPRRSIAEHIGVPPATFYRHFLKLRYHVRTLRGAD